MIDEDMDNCFDWKRDLHRKKENTAHLEFQQRWMNMSICKHHRTRTQYIDPKVISEL